MIWNTLDHKGVLECKDQPRLNGTTLAIFARCRPASCFVPKRGGCTEPWDEKANTWQDGPFEQMRRNVRRIDARNTVAGWVSSEAIGLIKGTCNEAGQPANVIMCELVRQPSGSGRISPLSRAIAVEALQPGVNSVKDCIELAILRLRRAGKFGHRNLFRISRQNTTTTRFLLPPAPMRERRSCAVKHAGETLTVLLLARFGRVITAYTKAIQTVMTPLVKRDDVPELLYGQRRVSQKRDGVITGIVPVDDAVEAVGHLPGRSVLKVKRQVGDLSEDVDPRIIVVGLTINHHDRGGKQAWHPGLHCKHRQPNDKGVVRIEVDFRVSGLDCFDDGRSIAIKTFFVVVPTGLVPKPRDMILGTFRK